VHCKFTDVSGRAAYRLVTVTDLPEANTGTGHNVVRLVWFLFCNKSALVTAKLNLHIREACRLGAL
jgi:hypothetical protein